MSGHSGVPEDPGRSSQVEPGRRIDEYDRSAVKPEVHGSTGQQPSCPNEHAGKPRSTRSRQCWMRVTRDALYRFGDSRGAVGRARRDRLPLGGLQRSERIPSVPTSTGARQGLCWQRGRGPDPICGHTSWRFGGSLYSDRRGACLGITRNTPGTGFARVCLSHVRHNGHPMPTSSVARGRGRNDRRAG